MCPHKKKSFLRLYSDNKDSGTNTKPVFNITAIENITAFEITQFIFNNTSLSENAIKINSRELSNLTYNTLQGSYNKSGQTIHEVNVALEPTDSNEGSPKYYVSDGRINRISFDFLNQDGDGYDAEWDNDVNWSMLIIFYHD